MAFPTSSDDPAIADLVLAAQQGNANAFNHLVLRYQDVVYSLCYRLTGNADDAADAAQDTFLAAFTHLRDFRGGRGKAADRGRGNVASGELGGAGEWRVADATAVAFRNWLLRSAANACYDLHRHRRRRPAESLDQAACGWRDDAHGLAAREGRPGTMADPQVGPEGRALQAELEALVQQELQAVPIDQRIALVLCDVHGLDYQSIAAATGVELGTVKSRLNRGRRRLRDLLLKHRELLPDQYRHR